MTESVWGPVLHVLASASVAFALSCSSGGSSGGGGGDCARACAHAEAVCPDQFSSRDKCESGCSQLSPGQVACLSVDMTCALLQSCVGEGPFVAQAGGATTAQCQQACSHAAARCPEQFSDQTKCQSGCAQLSPGQAACISAESSCTLLSRCVDE